MSGATLIYVLQTLLACAWAVPLIRKAGAVVRVMKQRPRGDDSARSAIWFVAASMECGALRWLIFPRAVQTMDSMEIFAWVGVYVLSILSALTISWTFWERYYDGY